MILNFKDLFIPVEHTNKKRTIDWDSELKVIEEDSTITVEIDCSTFLWIITCLENYVTVTGRYDNIEKAILLIQKMREVKEKFRLLAKQRKK